MPVEGRDLSSRRTQNVVRDLEIGQPINSEWCSETAEGVARESEGRSRLSVLRPVRQDQPRGHPDLCLCSVPLQQAVHRVWMVKTSRTSKRMGCNDGLANWRLRSGRRLTDRTPSEECSLPIRLIQTPTRYRMSHRTEGKSARKQFLVSD